MKLNYPSKPWRNGQRAMLIPGMEFMYSSSTKKWVPITPGYENEEQLQDSFNVRTIIELAEIFKTETAKIAGSLSIVSKFDNRIQSVEEATAEFDSDITQSGRIWKTGSAPSNPNPNDIWIDTVSGGTFSYDAIGETWVQQ